MNTEIEIRSFITKEEYTRLLEYFEKNGEFLGNDEQKNFYFDAEQDLRIREDNKAARFVLKSGKVHDESREEIEIPAARKEFEKMERFLRTLGYGINIKWFRKRKIYSWNGITVMLDKNKGYGHILELEKMTTGEDKEETVAALKGAMKRLGIALTPREDFDKAYAYYAEHWEELTAGEETVSQLLKEGKLE